jgi:CHAT domain-containing protein/Tfp pilus assembly protein PilF
MNRQVCVWGLAVLLGLGLFAGHSTPIPAQQEKIEAQVHALHEKAQALFKQGRYAEAARLYEQALTLTEEAAGKDHLGTAFILNELGFAYAEAGQYAWAERHYLRGLKIRETQLGPNHPHVATILNNLGTLYDSMGQYAKAEPLYLRCLQIDEATHGPNHPDVATSLNNLAELYIRLGQFAKAEPLHQRGLKIREARLGPDHPDVATSLNNLAWLYGRLGQHAKAEALYQRCLKILEARLGPDHPHVATALNNLAGLYERMRQYAQAEPLYLRSLKIREARLGPDHPALAVSFNNLAGLYLRLEQYAKAEPLYHRSLNIKEASLGPDHPDVALALVNLAGLYECMKRSPDAVTQCDRARRILRRHSARILPVLSEKEQAAFLRMRVEEELHIALSLALAHPNDATIVTAAASWLLNGKAVAQEALAAATLGARDVQDARVGPLTRQLLDVRQQLARLTLNPPARGQEAARQKQREQVAAREEDLARQLRRVGSQAIQNEAWVELDALRQRLPEGTVFVDLARFDVFHFHARAGEKQWQPAHYVAWMLPARGPVRLVDLGSAAPIDAAVQAVRQALEAAPQAIRQAGEPDAEKQLRPALEALAQKVLHPLLAHTAAAERWVISPDGLLWLVPWATLPLPDGTYAVEKHQIRYVVSGRDLVREASPTQTPLGRPVVLADPDYDLNPDKASALAKKLLRGQPAPGGLRSAGLGLRLPPVVRLPGTAAEAAAITPKLATFAQAKPLVYTDTEALEGVVKAVRQPKALVLCTHGFFLPDQAAPPSPRERDPATAAPGLPRENPLLRCGLLLAGCNRRGEKAPPGDEDGVLTGLEIVGTDLRGTELVVLSACETGLGQVQNGEGVAGLRQAFQLAGAQAVVATLWQVPDRETAQLMTRFFSQLADKQSKADALRQAQRALIQARRERNGAAHPFFWAAFTLTG